MARSYYQAQGLLATWPEIDTKLGILGSGLDALADRVPQQVGDIYYVSSVDGDDTYDGKSWEVVSATSLYGPLATIDEAIGKCTANNGDVIIVMPGHTETITGTDITADIAGISVIGVGRGGLMPQIKHNHADAEISIAAANIRWSGIRHSADVTGVKVAIEIEDGIDYCEVSNCRFDVVTTGTDEFLVSVRTNDASNNALIKRNFINMGLGGAVAGVSFTKDTDETEVCYNIIIGDYSTACIEGITTLSTNLLIHHNKLFNGLPGGVGTEPGIDLLTGSGGWIYDNDIMTNLATLAAAVVADGAHMFRNYTNEAVTETGTILGTANADD